MTRGKEGSVLFSRCLMEGALQTQLRQAETLEGRRADALAG